MDTVDFQAILNPNRVVLTGKTKNQTVGVQETLLQPQPVFLLAAFLADFLADFLAAFFADFFTAFFTVLAVFFAAFLDAFLVAFLTAFAMCKPSPKFCFSRRKRDRVKMTD
ncbi:MAG: hypothetical protein LBJ67_17320 [Planctomycetaceae bacterium]|jgi:hypothetical protein|nr:hypothetical protein [Planctomycetaceae bacterium]